MELYTVVGRTGKPCSSSEPDSFGHHHMVVAGDYVAIVHDLAELDHTAVA